MRVPKFTLGTILGFWFAHSYHTPLINAIKSSVYDPFIISYLSLKGLNQRGERLELIHILNIFRIFGLGFKNTIDTVYPSLTVQYQSYWQVKRQMAELDKLLKTREKQNIIRDITVLNQRIQKMKTNLNKYRA